MKVLPQGLTMPDLGAAGRSLLGVMAAAAAGLHWGAAGAATAAAGAAVITGATALQDSPRSPLPLVAGISIHLGVAVLLGTWTSSYGVLFVAVVAAWCFVAGMQWAVSANAGLVAAAAGALLVTAPPVEPTLSSVATATALAIGGGVMQAGLIALWPRRRWRSQRDALARAYRSLGVDAQKLAADPLAGVDAEPLIWLRDAFTLTDRQARSAPLAYRAWYGLPQRISVTLTGAGGQVRRRSRGRRRPAGRRAGPGRRCATQPFGQAGRLGGHVSSRRRGRLGGHSRRRIGAATCQPTRRSRRPAIR